jgi:hypothetical protein
MVSGAYSEITVFRGVFKLFRSVDNHNIKKRHRREVWPPSKGLCLPSESPQPAREEEGASVSDIILRRQIGGIVRP